MEPITYLEINKNDKIHKFLRENSNYYKYLNRSPFFINTFKSHFKWYSRENKVKKINDAIDNVDLFSKILDNIK